MSIRKFIKSETVLFIAGILAIASMFIVHPDSKYIDYIDFRTLSILFCLMSIVAGFREMGVFDRIAVKLLQKVKGMASVVLVLVLLYVGIRDRKILKKVDYSLLATFVALFIFIGNLGRIPLFKDLLQQFIEGREMLTAVLASQVMSNVPAAVLLEKFTDDIPALIVGTNLGGLGTLIASMASLISFKYMVREEPDAKGKYILMFTIVNVGFLGVWGFIMSYLATAGY